MTARDMTPLPEDVAELLASERRRQGVDAATRARLRGRIQTSILEASAAPSSDATPVPPRARPGLFAKLRLVHPALTGIVGFTLGLATGLAVHARLSSSPLAPAERLVVEAPTATAPAATAPAAAQPSAATTTDDAVPAARAPAAPPAAVPAASALTAERALLDIAHTAFSNGRAGDAMDALAQHTRRFPHGIYREEREALGIQSLRALGRLDEADRRAMAFKARYPKSLFLSTIDTSSPGAR